MPYNVVDGYDAELVDELTKVRRKFINEISSGNWDRIEVAAMVVAYALMRKETIK